MIITFEIPANPDVLTLLRELKEVRIQVAAYKFAIRAYMKSKRNKNHLLWFYASEISNLRTVQKANRLILKQYYEKN